jgi:hypothetical protein
MLTHPAKINIRKHMPIFISGASSLCRKIYEIYKVISLRVQNCYHLYQFIVGISSALKSDFNFFETFLTLETND